MGSMSRQRLTMVAAFLAVYVIWGTTYLGLRFGLEGFPPFILNGIRFSVAGGLLLAVSILRGQSPPTRRQWINIAMVGPLMLVGGVGLVTVAEDLGVGSGIAATAVAVIPVWAAVIAGLFGQWPRRLEWLGLAVGLLGVLVLSQEGDFRTTAAGGVLIVVAPILWSLGSVLNQRLDMPPGSTMSTATQLLVGGAVLLALGPLRGERVVEAPSLGAWIALGYLIVFGSIVALSAYVYLLRTVRPAMATSYAYVNPVVAVAAGVVIGGEVLTGPVFVAMPLILAGIALVTLAQRRGEATQPDPLLADEIAFEEAA